MNPSNPRLARARWGSALAAAALLCASAAHATDFAVLHHFDTTHGASPIGGLALDATGNLYGSTSEGGKYGFGTFFRLSSVGFKTLHQFRGGGDGAMPLGTLAVDGAGNVFGTTFAGGAANAGTVFEFGADARYRVLVALDGAAQGRGVQAGVAVDATGKLFGAATYGGDPEADLGTVFAFDPASRALTTLHTFLGDDGAWPEATPVVVGGTLHGTAWGGGVFSMLADGTGFANIGAGNTNDALIAAGQTPQPDGSFWGTAMVEVASGQGSLYQVDPAGNFSWSYAFNDDDLGTGRDPTGTLLRGQDGMLYGTTRLGGPGCRCGTVFRFDPVTSTLTTLHAFTGTDGRDPWAGLVQDAAGNLYGVASAGGRHDAGTVFRITP